MEKWKQIEDFKDYYISNKGSIIKNNYKTRTKANNNIKKINAFIKKDGYMQVSLYSKKTKKSYKKYVHRLVAEAFIPNPKNLPCINHIDCNKQNNYVDNLEWCTYSYNMREAYKTNLYKKRYGESNKLSKKYVELDINYNFIREFIGAREENKKLGYSRDTIQRCARGRTLSTHNKIYLFKEDYVINNKFKTKCNHMKRHNNYVNFKNKEEI